MSYADWLIQLAQRFLMQRQPGAPFGMLLGDRV